MSHPRETQVIDPLAAKMETAREISRKRVAEWKAEGRAASCTHKEVEISALRVERDAALSRVRVLEAMQGVDAAPPLVKVCRYCGQDVANKLSGCDHGPARDGELPATEPIPGGREVNMTVDQWEQFKADHADAHPTPTGNRVEKSKPHVGAPTETADLEGLLERLRHSHVLPSMCPSELCSFGVDGCVCWRFHEHAAEQLRQIDAEVAKWRAGRGGGK